jgi:probable rRNA maturation factor
MRRISRQSDLPPLGLSSLQMDLDILIEDPRWTGLDAQAQKALEATFAHLGLETEQIEVSLLACDDARIAQLNSDFRGKSQPTNVLSWPAEDLAAETDGGRPAAPLPDHDGALTLGDIAIAYETCEREASQAGKPMADHVTHLIVHGALHLLGYDHIGDADARLMQALEREILGKLGLDDPYRDNEAE